MQVGGFPVDARALGLEWGPSDFDVRHRFVASGLYEVPWLKDSAGLTRAILGGWQINGIVSLQSGFPFSVFTSRTYGNGGDFNGDGVNNDRPGLPSFGTDPGDLDKQDYIDGVFVASDFPITGFVLGDLPRNAYRGPGYASMDLSLIKNFRISTDTRVQFRVEAFNVLNRVNLRLPNGNLAQATFGKSTQSLPAREVQLGVKVIF